jgi:hypothetical protein
VDSLRRNSDVELAYADTEMMDETGRPVRNSAADRRRTLSSVNQGGGWSLTAALADSSAALDGLAAETTPPESTA